VALEDVGVDLPLWNMTWKQMLAADARDDGFGTVCNKQKENNEGI
jgi:hypothetical protein